MGHQADCRKWLRVSQKHGELPDKKHLKADTDLDSVCDKTWFKNFLKRLK